MYGKPRINVSALKGLGILENRKNQITLENCKLLGSNEKRNSIAVPCILFDFVRNGNYSAIDSCFYLYTVTSIDHLGTKIAIVQLIKHVFFSQQLLIRLCVQYSFSIWFFKSKKQHFKNQKKCFLYFKGFYRSRDIQILEFQILRFHDIIKCLIMKQVKHFTE